MAGPGPIELLGGRSLTAELLQFVAAGLDQAEAQGVAADAGTVVAMDPAAASGPQMGSASAAAYAATALDTLMHSRSPVDRLVNGADPLARFRNHAAPADPSPIATPGMTVRVGDIHADIATRHDIGGARLPAAVVETARPALAPDLVVRQAAGIDSRAVTPVRDAAAAAALPQRIEAPGGADAAMLARDTRDADGRIVMPSVAHVSGQAIAQDHATETVARAPVDGGSLNGASVGAHDTAAHATPSDLPMRPESVADTGHAASGSDAATAQVIPPGWIERRQTPTSTTILGDERARSGTSRPYLYALWYDILVERFADAGVRLASRSAALRDVVWALAIEHGPFAGGGRDIVEGATAGLDFAAADDAAIIGALFLERQRRAKGGLAHFPEVLPGDVDRVVVRLRDEARLALRRMTDPSSATAPDRSDSPRTT